MGSPQNVLWRGESSEAPKTQPGAKTVNPRLTGRKRAKRARSNQDYDGFVRRILRAYSRRVAEGDITALKDMSKLTEEIQAGLDSGVRGLCASSNGYTLADVARTLGVTKQATYKRWGRLV